MPVKYIDLEKVQGSVNKNQKFEQLFGFTPFSYLEEVKKVFARLYMRALTDVSLCVGSLIMLYLKATSLNAEVRSIVKRTRVSANNVVSVNLRTTLCE